MTTEEKPDLVKFLKEHYDLNLKRKGSNKYVACCPFHNEKTPSFTVFTKTQTYKCFGCGEHGDVINFVQKIEGTDFKGALKILDLGNDYQTDYKPAPRKEPATAVPQKFFDREKLVSALITPQNYQNNVFAKWIVEHFEGTPDHQNQIITKERIFNVLKSYGVCSGKEPAKVCFPYIDREKRIVQVKTMHYEVRESKVATHDCKSIKPESRTLHSGAGYQFTCLFGTHLIKPHHILCLVESEKTAILGTLFHLSDPCPVLFLAVGGQKYSKEHFKFLAKLPNQYYCYIPDEDALKQRAEKGEESMLMKTVDTLHSLGISPINLIKKWLKELPETMHPKADIADYLVWLALPF